jgi:hypothetical protein
MAIIFGKIKCYLCGEKDGVFKSVCEYGCYGDVGKRIFYHQECLEMVERKPEKFGHRMIDKALHINDLVKQCIKYNSNIETNFKKKIESLHRNNFERMMPKQW